MEGNPEQDNQDGMLITGGAPEEKDEDVEEGLDAISGNNQYLPETVEGGRFQNILETQYGALDSMLNTITLYYDEDYIRSINDGNPVAIDDLSQWFDAGKTRTYIEDGNKYQITLGDEFHTIAQKFLGEFEDKKPDLSVLRKLPGVIEHAGVMYIPEKQTNINTYNPVDIINAELMMAEMTGKDIELIAADMRKVSGAYLDLGSEFVVLEEDSAEPLTNRSIYKTTDQKHHGGVIYSSLS